MTADVPEITVEELADRLATGRLIDVRERDEFGDGHVPGAENVPLSELDGAIVQGARDDSRGLAAGTMQRGWNGEIGTTGARSTGQPRAATAHSESTRPRG